ncbi:hypothetical protein [Fonticella tunisiensis]|uniref:Ribosomally synthesized peptide with SipW-like signal peptide n=1 Tax=Fonticella tunisiensis TaxID=1096341 RepID=A0A4R7KB87_9CLOT|nr:hypothetical protein [Fonticella tunisiensis]TDT50756.1 hypothetical protein EDD71_12547 [Fonticella tunisiensis]
MKIKIKRNTILCLVAAVIMISISNIAYAIVYGPTVSWDYGSGKTDLHGSYCPYSGTGWMSFWNENGKNLLNVRTSNMLFNQYAVNAIQNYMNTKGWYFTWDISNTNDYDETIDATGWLSTNLPNPKIDIEDDPWPFGNGYNDETEVVALSLVNSSTAYYVISQFEDKRNGTSGGTIQTRACMSSKSITGEYNTELMSDVPQQTFTYGKNPGQP